MPSQPSLQASRNTISPSSPKHSLKTILTCEPFNSSKSNSFRSSIGLRRKSFPSSSSKSNAESTALSPASPLSAPRPAECTTHEAAKINGFGGADVGCEMIVGYARVSTDGQTLDAQH